MNLTELNSKNRKIVVIFSGAFQPPMPHHIKTYEWLTEQFPQADVYMASSNVTSERPFGFKQKQWLATQAGVPASNFVQVKNPYSAEEITRNYDATSTVLVFAFSEKDKDRLGSNKKKDGSPKYIQPWPGSVEKCETMDKHGYFVITPLIKWDLLGKEMDSASTFRNWYIKSQAKTRLEMAKALYPNSKKPRAIREILDGVLLPSQLNEFVFDDENKVKEKAKIRKESGALFRNKYWYNKIKDTPLKKNEQIKVGKTADTVVPLINDILKYKLYVPSWQAQGVFGSIRDRIIKYKENNTFPIGKLAVMYVDGKPVAWTFRTKPSFRQTNTEDDRYWRFTKPEYRANGYYQRLKKAVEEPFKVNESPDFGYSKFNDRDSDIKSLTFREVPFEHGFMIYAELKDSKIAGRVTCRTAPQSDNIIRVSSAFVQTGKVNSFDKSGNSIETYYKPEDWRGSGLGQILYDKAIYFAKKLGYKYFQSDYSRSKSADNAWAKLSNRYITEKVPVDKSIGPKSGMVFQINLEQV